MTCQTCGAANPIPGYVNVGGTYQPIGYQASGSASDFPNIPVSPGWHPNGEPTLANFNIESLALLVGVIVAVVLLYLYIRH